MVFFSIKKLKYLAKKISYFYFFLILANNFSKNLEYNAG